MKLDLFLCGVGGQGILSIAYVLDHSAQESGFHFKQPEVHGMAQRGGAVHAQLRISDRPVSSGLIPAGAADLVLSLEPMESLRYLNFMSRETWLITDVSPHVNIADYPALDRLHEVLFGIPKVIAVNGAYLAKKAGMSRAQNMVILGAAAPWLPFNVESLEKHIHALFEAKDQRIQQANLKAFLTGRSAGYFCRFFLERGFPAGRIARIAARLDFDSTPPETGTLEGWGLLLSHRHGDEFARQIFSADKILPLREEIPRELLKGIDPRSMSVGTG